MTGMPTWYPSHEEPLKLPTPAWDRGNGTGSWDSHVSSQLFSARLLRGGAAAGAGPDRPVFSTNRKDGSLLGDKTKQFKEPDLIIRHTKPWLAGPIARTRKVTWKQSLQGEERRLFPHPPSPTEESVSKS